jgi:hypothetical protein
MVVEFLFRKGYKSGVAGINLFVIMLLYDVLKEMKFYEWNHGLNTGEIELMNDQVRDSILQEFKK